MDLVVQEALLHAQKRTQWQLTLGFTFKQKHQNKLVWEIIII